MSGNRITPTVELKEELREVKKALPKDWLTMYVNKFHKNTKGMKMIETYRRLENISKGNSAPKPTELRNIKSLIEEC
jgi:hypothetical protein